MTSFLDLYFTDQDKAAGAVTPQVADLLCRDGLAHPHGDGLAMAATGSALETALADAGHLLYRAGLIGPPRQEIMPVRIDPDGPEIARIDRHALRVLGLWGDKVHINGLVEDGQPPGRPAVWLSVRAAHALAYPGAFDTLVAGGRPVGSSALDTAWKEGWEEAGLDPEHLNRMRPVRRWQVVYPTPRALYREVLIVHDLVLPPGFEPVCHDGEIERSVLFSWTDFRALVASGDGFKPNSRMVSADLAERLEADPGADQSG